MKNQEPAEKEFKKAAKDVLLKKTGKPLKPCSEYPNAEELNQKFKLEKKPRQKLPADLNI